MSENQFADSSAYEPTPTSNATLWVTAVGVAFAVVMLLAILMPRLVGDGTVNWTVTLLAGVLSGAVVLGIAYIKRGRGEREPVAD